MHLLVTAEIPRCKLNLEDGMYLFSCEGWQTGCVGKDSDLGGVEGEIGRGWAARLAKCERLGLGLCRWNKCPDLVLAQLVDER